MRISAAFADRRDTIFSNFICSPNSPSSARKRESERDATHPCVRCPFVLLSGFTLLSRFSSFFVRVARERDPLRAIAMQSDASGFRFNDYR